MRKLTFTFIACFAFFQTVQADAPALISPVHFSLQHFEALTSTLQADPDFQNIISSGEFITNLKIQKGSVNASQGNVYINITTTRLPIVGNDVSAQDEVITEAPDQGILTRNRRHGFCKNKRSNTTKIYTATLLLTPSDVGSPSITVVSIEQGGRQCKKPISKNNDQKETQLLESAE